MDLSRGHGEASNLNPAPQPPQPEQPQQTSPNNNTNGGLSDRQIGELQMAAQAAAAAQHGPSMSNRKHPNDGSLVAGDYADKRQKTGESPTSGQHFLPTYPNPNA